MSNLADGALLPAGYSFMILIPFVVMGAALWFICRAFKDRSDERPADPKVVVLPDRKDRPLYEVHIQIRAAGRKPRGDPEPDEANEPRQRRNSGTRLVVHQ